MRTSKYLQPKTNFETTLPEVDARIIPFEKVNGRELNDLIQESLRRYYRWAPGTTFPNTLIVTQKQFASLSLFTEEMNHTTDRMFVVLNDQGGILCLMEVLIDREIDTIQDIDDIIEESEEMLAENDFSKLEMKKVDVDPTKPNVLSPDTWQDQF